ncbi:MAG TPA: ATP-binding protein [Candidatus Dormibacteraeota bacterium]|nr:ATP-binding protein [Candidatus Dormibacteraeota bacterium]
MSANNWYVITGGPSAGKTTLISRLEQLGYQTVPEAARVIIDKAVAKGLAAGELRSDEKHFQEDVARLKTKLEAKYDKNTPTFFDRGMHDTLAYLRLYDFRIEKWVEELMPRSNYKKVFLLEPLGDYEQDYARTESRDTVKQLHQLLHEAYAEYGMKPIRIKATTVDERLKTILDQI